MNIHSCALAVKATFVGHDHTNNFCVPYQGIQLCYEGSPGFQVWMNLFPCSGEARIDFRSFCVGGAGLWAGRLSPSREGDGAAIVRLRGGELEATGHVHRRRPAGGRANSLGRAAGRQQRAGTSRSRAQSCLA